MTDICCFVSDNNDSNVRMQHILLQQLMLAVTSCLLWDADAYSHALSQPTSSQSFLFICSLDGSTERAVACKDPAGVPTSFEILQIILILIRRCTCYCLKHCVGNLMTLWLYMTSK